MSRTAEKVVVAMSGGVDSSVAAGLLVEQGYDVMGLFMRVGRSEPAAVRTCAPEVGIAGNSLPVELGTHASQARADKPPVAPLASLPPVAPLAHAASLPPVAPLPTVAARPHQGCCSASDAADARFVAGMLGIPFYALNFEAQFDGIIDYFADEYARGRTPNPCVMCNDKLKFGKLMDYADAVGARYVATGHYARLDRCSDGVRLLRAADARKDQSYVLFGLRRTVLDRLLFPLGELTKSEVRAIARQRGFPNCDKPDSVEICFAPDRDYARVVRERRPDAFVPGEVMDESGRILGRHDGIAHYTVGQRRGLRIAAGKPIYVTALDVRNNRVMVGSDNDLARPGLFAERVNLLADLPECFRADVKIRYLHRAVPATVCLLASADPGAADSAGLCARVTFDEPQRAVTPGQAVVFYDADTVLGGGWIERADTGFGGQKGV